MGIVKNGYITALGTPITEAGDLVEASLARHINQQIEHGASGLLLMGSMGIEANIKLSAYKDAVRVASETNAGRLPLFVGAMDTSIAKVREKIEAMKDYKVDGLVITAPFYGKASDEKAINWFTKIADISPIPVYMYDLPWATQYKLTIGVMSKLVNHKNIKGMKTADWELIKKIERNFPDADFECLCSALDDFDYMNIINIKKNLDGMFSCTPINSQKMYECLAKNDFAGARVYLDKILRLRDAMAGTGRLMSCFTHCMNLLGCEGNFHEDFALPASDEMKANMEKIMKELGEI